MAYSLDSISDGCYENTAVLINKFDIRDEKQLNALEQTITSVLIAKASIEIPFENVDFEFYKSLHKYVFSDIYEWAEEIRKVNISKKGTNFCPVEKIEENGLRIFNNLHKAKFYKALEGDAFIDKFVELYCELNYLHPFREGNGRIQRLFLSMLLKHNGKKIDFAEIDEDLFMIATIKSISGDIFMLKDIFKKHIKSL
ncbi:MAG: Fic family protein [Clostridia bacterium]|nr:Fic family protein [Clostridia bacterium]